MSDRLQNVIDQTGWDDWSHDPWGTAMAAFFDIAAVLDSSDIEGDITPAAFARWDYHRGAHTIPGLETLAADIDNEDSDHSYGEVSLAHALHNGHITQADLIYAGNVLDRYTALLDAAGKSY